MPDPTSGAVATLIAASAAVPPLTAFGVSLGLRPDILIAGFAGCLVAIILFDSVPGEDDTWRKLVRTSARRMFAAFASALTAGYGTPLLMYLLNVPTPFTLGMAFAIGAAGKLPLAFILGRYWPKAGGAS